MMKGGAQMNERYNMKSLLEMDGGAFLERSDYEVSKVMDNILDPNTRARDPRKLILTFVFRPNDDCILIPVEFTAKSVLATTSPVLTSLYVAGDGTTGELCVVEMAPQLPGQFMLDGTEQERPAQLKLIKLA